MNRIWILFIVVFTLLCVGRDVMAEYEFGLTAVSTYRLNCDLLDTPEDWKRVFYLLFVFLS